MFQKGIKTAPKSRNHQIWDTSLSFAWHYYNQMPILPTQKIASHLIKRTQNLPPEKKIHQVQDFNPAVRLKDTI